MNRLNFLFSFATLMIVTGNASAGDWEAYRPEAEHAWANLRKLSASLSFSFTKRTATNDEPLKEVERADAAIRNEAFYMHGLDSSSERVGVVASDYGFLLSRDADTRNWTIHQYSPERKSVLVNIGDEIHGIRCPPLTPTAKVTVEELLAVDGLRNISAEEFGESENRRVRLTINFPDHPVTIRDEVIEAHRMIYEFDPSRHWVVTKTEMIAKHFSGVDSIEYELDEEHRPLLRKIVSNHEWLKAGTRQTIEKEFTKYEYHSAPEVFEPATYGLPPISSPAAPPTSQVRRVYLLTFAVVIIVSAILLRRRTSAKKNH